jgi:hypothetical protein
MVVMDQMLSQSREDTAEGINYATVRTVKKKLDLRVPAVSAARHREVTESTQSRLDVHMGSVC